jgi:hypothetical protein
MAYETDDSIQMRFYRQGIAAHASGKTVNSCDVIDPVRQAWFRAGWHDSDIEAGNTVLRDNVINAIRSYL